MNAAVIALFLLAVITDTGLCQSAENVSKVHEDFLTLNPNVRPAKDLSTQTNISVAFHLLSITSFDTVNQRLISNGWLDVMWVNDYVKWDPADYGGVGQINPPPQQVWRPRITVQNTLKDLRPVGEKYVVIIIDAVGRTLWYPAEHFETFCRIDVTYFPFDTQRCTWDLFVWGEDLETSNLLLFRPSIDLDDFERNGEWELMSTKAWREVRVVSGARLSFLRYEVTLRRRPALQALTVLLPVMVLSLVNVFVFTVPSEAGERLAYSMTALLSFGVFMGFILGSIPSSTETLPIVAVNLSTLLVLSAVYVLLCILSLRLFHRDPVKHPVPGTLQSLVVWMEVLVCLHPPATHKVGVIPVQAASDLASSDVTGLTNVEGMTDGGLKGKLDKWAMTKKMQHAVYSDPEEMTWRRVSRTMDKLFFRFFFGLVLLSNAAVWGVMVNNYHNYS